MTTGAPKHDAPGQGPQTPDRRPRSGDTDVGVAMPPLSAADRQPDDDRFARRSDDSDGISVEPTQVGDVPADPSPSEPILIMRPSEEDPYVGKVISERYRVIRKIGEGGMGTVYLAEHIVIEKKVALKILSDDFARKADLVARFMQEAKAASRIGHENIVDITDFGQTDAGSVFFAMEYLEGCDLATLIRDAGPLPFERARPIVYQICRALGAAHGKGIIHRDMKPENIFIVERDGRADFVKILDFGIAKMSAGDEANERLTRTGMIFGTPEYMSPEQARGERPDHRVDIYAVGCILYEMLTGDVPFHAETFMGVLTKHMFEPPDSPTQRAPEAHVPADAEAVVMRALSKNRDERYQTMREFALAVAACEGGDEANAWGLEGSAQFRSPSSPLKQGTGSLRTPPVVVPEPELAVVSLAPRSYAARWLGGAAILVTIVAGIMMWERPAPRPFVPTAVSLSETPKETPVVPIAAPPVVVKPEQHKIRVGCHMTCPGAELFRGPERLGSLPGVFLMEHSEQEVMLTATRKGAKDYRFEVRPDHDREYEAKLELISRRPPQAVVRRPARSVAPAQLPPPVVEKAQEPPKPRKARDLMDPFSPDRTQPPGR